VLKLFLLTLILSFLVIAGTASVVTWSRRRISGSRHGLSGRCQRTGQTMCPSCQDIHKRQGTKA
jgi:hypothetical protein